MTDRHGNYIRLFGTLFFTFIGFIIAVMLVLLGLRGLFGLLSFIPGLVNIFTLFIISVPAALFISVYIIYIRRTASHPSPPVRIISYILFAAALIAWVYFFITDLVIYFKHYYTAVAEYMSYDLIFLVTNVFSIFFVGIIQALTAKKEVDWFDRKRDY